MEIEAIATTASAIHCAAVSRKAASKPDRLPFRWSARSCPFRRRPWGSLRNPAHCWPRSSVFAGRGF